VRQVDRDIRHEVRTTGKRPRDAFADMIMSLSKRFKSPELHEKVITKIPPFGKLRTQLTRLRTERLTGNSKLDTKLDIQLETKPYVPDPMNILAAIGGLEPDDDKEALKNELVFTAEEPGMCTAAFCWSTMCRTSFVRLQIAAVLMNFQE